MTEQRLVPVELLNDCLREAGYLENFSLVARIRAIIDGPGVDPVATAIESVASWIESQRNVIPATGAEFAAAIRSEFKFSPQPPAK